MSISNETDRLRALRRILNQTAPYVPSLPVQIGVNECDDAALIQLPDGRSLVVASDFVRGSGFYLFQLGYLDYFDVGYYLIAANLSDIAAMGAAAVALTTVVRYGDRMTDEQFEQVFQGMKLCADTYKVPIVGGDIGGYEADVFAATALGLVETDKALLRRNVKSEDLLCVTGEIGLPMSAIVYFKNLKPSGIQLAASEEQRLLNSWRRPVPRLKEGLLLSERRIANACQDVSDGLKATIEQISKLSGKYFDVHESSLPISETTRELASYLKIPPAQLAMSASIDFQLLFTMPREKRQLCDGAFVEQGLRYSVIGEVNNMGRNRFVASDGTHSELPGVPWEHQKSDLVRDVIYRRAV